MSPAAAITFSPEGSGGSVSSVSEASVQPGSAGWSVRPSESLSSPSEQAGSGGGGGGSVSSVSEASVQPGSAGWSVRPSESLSSPSEQAGAAGGEVVGVVSTTSCGWFDPASRL